MICAWLLLSAMDPTLERGYRALDEWQLPVAREVAEHLIATSPHDANTLALASHVQFARGEYSSAASLYATAIESGAESDDAYARVLLKTYNLTRGYLEKESEHFRVAYPPGKDDILADELLPALEGAYGRIAQDLGLSPDPSDKIAVLVVPDAPALADVSTLTTSEIETSGTIAICKFNRLMITSPLATLQGYDWADTLAHEYTHLVINLVAKGHVPIWLHEGIAKYMESRWDGAPGRALTPASVNLLAKAAKADKFIPFERMHPSMAKLPSQEEAGLAFAEVFVAMKVLQQKRGVVALREVLRKLGDGQSVEAAVSEVYGKPFAVFLTDWRQALRGYKGKMMEGAPAQTITLGAPKSAAKDVAELEPIADKKVKDAARLAELLHLRGHLRAAVSEYEKAYVLAGVRYPSLINKYAMALLQLTQPAADSSRERPAKEMDALDRAKAILLATLVPHPSYTPARLTLGRLAMQAGDSALAKEQYRAAMYQNPYIPEIYAAFVKIDSSDAEANRHLLLSLGKDLPGPAAQLEGKGKLTLLFAPFGRARLPDGHWVAYPAVNINTRPIDAVELVARDGKTKAVKLQAKGEALSAEGTL